MNNILGSRSTTSVRWMLTLTASIACSCASIAGRADEKPGASAAATSNKQSPQQAIDRAIGFLISDAAKWRKDRGCATCHHGAMSVWALSEAKRQGHAVDATALADIVAWTKDSFVPRVRKPRDSRPGWNLVSIAGIYLGVMSQELPVLSRVEVNELAVHLARHQEEDGAWLMPPPNNGAPPTWESRETMALLALLAWEPYAPADPQEAAANRAAREKTIAWLTKQKPSKTTQATALRLVLDVRAGKPTEQLQVQISTLLGRQNSDGGWCQVPDAPSDAYATGQTLWALSVAGLDRERTEMQRALAFLAANQRDDGSWPMKSRNHPEVESKRTRNPIPITYFGSTWATIGLARLVPPALDSAAKQQKAFDSIREFGGSYETDDKDPAKPVVSAKIVYEVDDAELAKLVKLFTAFPKLTALQFKSGRLSDAGLAAFKDLPQLRSLSLETSPITDAGLAHLETLTALETLNLKGTKVTDAGVERLQKALPKVKIER